MTKYKRGVHELLVVHKYILKKCQMHAADDAGAGSSSSSSSHPAAGSLHSATQHAPWRNPTAPPPTS
jgi:hypothetical protein